MPRRLPKKYTEEEEAEFFAKELVGTILFKKKVKKFVVIKGVGPTYTFPKGKEMFIYDYSIKKVYDYVQYCIMDYQGGCNIETTLYYIDENKDYGTIKGNLKHEIEEGYYIKQNPIKPNEKMSKVYAEFYHTKNKSMPAVVKKIRNLLVKIYGEP